MAEVGDAFDGMVERGGGEGGGDWASPKVVTVGGGEARGIRGVE